MLFKLSLYIPRVANNCYKQKIDGNTFHNITGLMQHIFHEHEIGSVERVDVVPIRGQIEGISGYSRAFVHFNSWYNTPEARLLQETITYNMMSKKNPRARITYNDPDYWIIHSIK